MVTVSSLRSEFVRFTMMRLIKDGWLPNRTIVVLLLFPGLLRLTVGIGAWDYILLLDFNFSVIHWFDCE